MEPMELKTKNTFRDDFMQALYEVRRAFLKNNLLPPREIVLEGGHGMEMNILQSLTPLDFNDPCGYRNFGIGVEIMGINVRVVRSE